MTSKIVVNNIEADTGVSTVTFNSNVVRGDSNLHSTGLALGAGSTVGAVTGVTTYYGDGSQLTGISVDSTKIETGNTKVETVDTGSDGHVKITTEGSERVRIDSSGRVMLGTTTEGNVNADDLTVATSGEGGITIRTGASSNGNIFFSDATSGAGEYAGIIDYKHSSNAMTFGTNGTEKMRILSGGQIGMGMDPTSQYFNSLVVGNNDAGDKGITIRSNAGNSGVLAFSDSDAATSARYAGYISYVHSDNSMRFHTTAGDERLRITNTGVLETYGGGGGAALKIKNGGDIEIYHANNSDKVTIYCDNNNQLTIAEKLRFYSTSGGILRSNGNHALKPTGACIQTKRTYRGSKFTNSSGSYQVVHSHDFSVEAGNKIAIHLDCDMNADTGGSSWQMMGLRIGSTFYSEKIIEHNGGMNMNASANGLTDAMSAGQYAVQFVTRNGGGTCSYNEANNATGIVLHTYEYVS